jgi:hypothetical protein
MFGDATKGSMKNKNEKEISDERKKLVWSWLMTMIMMTTMM